ncbi:MAG: ABC transporter permease [Granulosicoccus sp.]|nr:ABC transporter permease [Granulosicoccus sp.]
MLETTRLHTRSWMLFSLVLFLLIWGLLSHLLNDNSLPSPRDVFLSLINELRSGELVYHVGITLLRVFAAFLVAMVIGSAIGIWLGMNTLSNRLVEPWLVLLLNIPALVIIVLSYIWFGLNEAAAIGAVALNKIPNVIVTMREGARSLSREYAEMAYVYRFGTIKRLRHVVLPQLQPFFAAATRSGVALIWKIVLVVELLGRSNGVGFQIHLYFQLFDVATILAYTFAFVAIMLIVEYLILQPLEKKSVRWRNV